MRFAAGLLLLAGCPPADVPCGDPLAIGTGTRSFEALADGDTLEIVLGNQGGYHLPLAAQVCRVTDPGAGELVATVVSTGEVVASLGFDRAWLENGDCCEVVLDIAAVLSGASDDTGYGYGYAPFDVGSVDGKRIAITLTVTDAAGEVHEASLEVVARAP